MSDCIRRKRAVKIEGIISAALRVWSRSSFTELTMDSVAEEFGCSKPALYRYFPSKQVLVEKAQQRSILRVIEFAESAAAQLRSGGAPDSIALLCETADAVFRDSPQEIACVIFRSPFFSAGQLADLEAAGKSVESALAESIGREEAAFCVFAVLLWYSAGQFVGCGAEVQAMSRDWVYSRCRYGVFSDPSAMDFDADRIERHFRLDVQSARRTPHRFFTAIEEVVHEVGLANATLQKIAERIGMSASSLYFHFSGRSEMLQQTIEQERGFFIAVYQELAGDYRTSLLGHLYGFVLALDDYYRINPELLTVGTWLRNYTVPGQGPELTGRIVDSFPWLSGSAEIGLLADGLKLEYVLMFLNMYSLNGSQMENSRDESIRRKKLLLPLLGTDWFSVSGRAQKERIDNIETTGNRK
ncbi:TetR/AcrR family transcriptional regulator [Spirochaeta dissipatitropha]